jgi:CRISPR-associated protein Csb3
MTQAQPNITLTEVDAMNPGQFFACCGLLELAYRLCPGAEGWFEGSAFHVSGSMGLDRLLEHLAAADIRSSLSPEERSSLGTLLSKEKDALTELERIEKTRLQQMWRIECLWLSKPFDIWLDWWRDNRGERTDLKTWAAKQMVADMADRMFSIVRQEISRRSVPERELFFESDDDSLPFNFDSDLCRTGNARDAGFSADTLGFKSSYRPLLELLAFIALQRFQPVYISEVELFIYCAWGVPLPPPVAAAAASGAISVPLQRRYGFALFNRTKYMKAFLPATGMDESQQSSLAFTLRRGSVPGKRDGTRLRMARRLNRGD